MATHRRPISMSPRRGDLSPKKAADQRILKINWIRKKIKVILNRGWSCLCQTMNRDIPMSINRLIQTGPNIQSGGVKKGFFNVLYQVGMAGVVKREPRKPANWQRTILIASLRISLAFTSPSLIRRPPFVLECLVCLISCCGLQTLITIVNSASRREQVVIIHESGNPVHLSKGGGPCPRER